MHLCSSMNTLPNRKYLVTHSTMQSLGLDNRVWKWAWAEFGCETQIGGGSVRDENKKEGAFSYIPPYLSLVGSVMLQLPREHSSYPLTWQGNSHLPLLLTLGFCPT